jgi:(p)ppGpp synthase/HD superfamily hydrolase
MSQERKLSPLPMKAWRFAAERHQGQLYPGSDLPYITHVGMVLTVLTGALEREMFSAGAKWEKRERQNEKKDGTRSRALPVAGLDVDLAKCCAILHDTVEDTTTSVEEIAQRFGKRVAAGVAALTKNKALGDEAMADSLIRIREQPREVWLVKLADRIANMSTFPPHWSEEKRLAYAAEAGTILRELGEASELLAQWLTDVIAAWHGEVDFREWMAV